MDHKKIGCVEQHLHIEESDTEEEEVIKQWREEQMRKR
jgi:hypothetical protein